MCTTFVSVAFDLISCVDNDCMPMFARTLLGINKITLAMMIPFFFFLPNNPNYANDNKEVKNKVLYIKLLLFAFFQCRS